MNEKKTIAELRKFGLTLGIAFPVLGGLLWWRGHTGVAMIPAGLGAILLLAAVLVPGWLGPVERTWMGLAEALSKVTTPIFMGIVYFLVVTPTGMLMKVFGRDPLAANGREDSLWARYPGRSSAKDDMRRQF